MHFGFCNMKISKESVFINSLVLFLDAFIAEKCSKKGKYKTYANGKQKEKSIPPALHADRLILLKVG